MRDDLPLSAVFVACTAPLSCIVYRLGSKQKQLILGFLSNTTAKGPACQRVSLGSLQGPLKKVLGIHYRAYYVPGYGFETLIVYRGRIAGAGRGCHRRLSAHARSIKVTMRPSRYPRSAQAEQCLRQQHRHIFWNLPSSAPAYQAIHPCTPHATIPRRALQPRTAAPAWLLGLSGLANRHRICLRSACLPLLLTPSPPSQTASTRSTTHGSATTHRDITPHPHMPPCPTLNLPTARQPRLPVAGW